MSQRPFVTEKLLPRRMFPIDAQTITGPSGLAIRVFWNELIEPVVPPDMLAGRNWTANIQGQRLTGVNGSAISNTTTVLMRPGGTKTGTDVVDYSAEIPDVIAALDGLPAAAFADFPVRIV